MQVTARPTERTNVTVGPIGQSRLILGATVLAFSSSALASESSERYENAIRCIAACELVMAGSASDFNNHGTWFFYATDRLGKSAGQVFDDVERTYFGGDLETAYERRRMCLDLESEYDLK